MADGGDVYFLSRFFRVLLPGFAEKLSLPRAFVKRLSMEESKKRATLANPDGKSWRVDVYKDKQDVYFAGDSWVHFLNAHNIEVGYFLVFCYRGNMVFDFQAYDLSTCEIVYPTIFLLEKKRRVIKTPSVTLKAKKRRVVETLKVTKDQDSVSSERRVWHGIRFESKMTKYNLSMAYLYIPVGVVEKCSDLTCLNELRLEDPKGRSWHVNLFHRKRPPCGGSGTHIGKGWPQFVRGNKLKIGDICVFEFVSEGKEKVVNVQIVRKASD